MVEECVDARNCARWRLGGRVVVVLAMASELFLDDDESGLIL
jgi:hypothetical protein